MKNIIYTLLFLTACTVSANSIKIHQKLNNNYYLGENMESRSNYLIWYFEEADSIEKPFWDDYYIGEIKNCDSLFYNDSLIVTHSDKKYTILNSHNNLWFITRSRKKYVRYINENYLSEIVYLKPIGIYMKVDDR